MTGTDLNHDVEFARAHAALARQGWALLHGAPFLAGEQPDLEAVLRIASRFGSPSTRDGGRAVWPVAVTTDQTGATFSIRAGEAGLHTDAQYRRVPEDLVCLFAARPAASGGVTRLLHAANTRAALLRHPKGEWALQVLARPSWSWKAPEIFEAEPPFRAPVLPGDGTVRWRIDTLAPGLTAAQELAAAVFETSIQAAPEVVEVALGAGDVVVVDNHRTLHGRTAFSDPRRLLLRVRLWRRGS
jgi:alpha-ketoglutarate-dependent taurine dioxygenase